MVKEIFPNQIVALQSISKTSDMEDINKYFSCTYTNTSAAGSKNHTPISSFAFSHTLSQTLGILWEQIDSKRLQSWDMAARGRAGLLQTKIWKVWRAFAFGPAPSDSPHFNRLPSENSRFGIWFISTPQWFVWEHHIHAECGATGNLNRPGKDSVDWIKGPGVSRCHWRSCGELGWENRLTGEISVMRFTNGTSVKERRKSVMNKTRRNKKHLKFWSHETKMDLSFVGQLTSSRPARPWNMVVAGACCGKALLQ